MRRRKKRPPSPTELLIKKIRRLPKYKKWREKVLEKDVTSYPKLPKGVQVHHRTEMATLIKKYEITTVKKALKCKALWKLELGLTLKRGEHFILTKLARYKYLSPGFRENLDKWLNTCTVKKLGSK